MIDDPIQLVAVGLVTLFAGFIYSAIGFGYALLAVPALLFCDLTLPQVLAIVNVAIVAQGATVVRHMRRDVEWRMLAPFVAVALVAMSIGVVCLYHVTNLPSERVKQLVGVIVLGVLLVQWYWKVDPQPRLHWGWGVLAFGCSGFIGGMVATAGPPVVLWAMAHAWSNKRTRATLWSTFLCYVPFHFFMLYVAFPKVVPGAIVMGLPFAVTTAVGSMIGMRVGRRIPRPRLRRIGVCVLIIIAIMAILSPVFQS